VQRRRFYCGEVECYDVLRIMCASQLLGDEHVNDRVERLSDGYICVITNLFAVEKQSSELSRRKVSWNVCVG
jgi:hypothetical protein